MTRINSTNYSGAPETTFAWATAGSDRFSRTRDLYYLAQALELHDHTAGKGLAAARMAPLSVTTAMLDTGSVTGPKISTDAVTALAVALDAIGASELADNSVDTAAIIDLAVTNPKIAANTIDLLTKATYVPVNKAGDFMNGNLTGVASQLIWKGLTTGLDGITLGGPIQGGSLLFGTLQLLGLFIGGNGIVSTGPMTIGGSQVLKATDAVTVPAAGAIPRADGSGKLDAWITSAVGVPSGHGGWVPTAAAIPSGYTRYANLDGKMPIGAGTSFSVTYLENTAYGSSWFHSHLTSGATHAHTVSGSTGNNSAAGTRGGTGSSTADDPHTHTGASLAISAPTGSTATSSDAWGIPSYAIVWITKN